MESLTMTEISQLPTLSGDLAPFFRLTIGGAPIGGDGADIRFEYPEQNGASRLTFEGMLPAEHLIEERVRLSLGYGRRGLLYFAGRLILPGGERVVLGPFAEMAAQHMMRRADYRGWFIGPALYDIARRANYPSGTVEVRGERSYRIPDDADEAVFNEEVSLMEAANTLMQSANFVASDAPGGIFGRRLFMPRPRPGARGGVKAVYVPRHYEPGSLEVEDKHSTGYARVVVFRRRADGTYSLRQEAPVDNMGRRVPQNRAYFIPEFVGDSIQAKQAAYDTARSLSAGEFSFRLSGIRINPELSRYDQIRVSRNHETRDGIFREVYQGVIHEVSGSVSGWRMDLSGDAIRVERRKVGRPSAIVPDSVSPGVATISA
jgi:hypothetical protein